MDAAADVDPCDRASTCTDGVHLHHGYLHREAAKLTACGKSHLIIVEQSKVAAGAADINSNDIFFLQEPRHIGRRKNAARRS